MLMVRSGRGVKERASVERIVSVSDDGAGSSLAFWRVRINALGAAPRRP
jgi:hypothetical protein